MSQSILKNISLFVAIVFVYNNANAIEELSTSSFTDINFGNIEKKKGQDTSKTISVSDVSHGRFTIKGSDEIDDKIRVIFESCGFNADNVKIAGFTANYDGESWEVEGDGPTTKTNLPNPTLEGKVLKYGATAYVKQDATTGDTNACYSVSIQYECAFDDVPCTTEPPVVLNNNPAIQIDGFPMTLTQITQLNFGKITKPSQNSSISFTSGGSTTVAQGDTTIVGNGNKGVFELDAESNVSVNLGVEFVSSSDPGLEITDFSISMNNQTAVQVDNNGKIFTTSSSKTTNDLVIDGVLFIRPSVTSGSKDLTYKISVDYE